MGDNNSTSLTKDGASSTTTESVPITIYVGQGDTVATFNLPKDLLVDNSPFFDAALKGRFAEAKLKSINLPDDTKEILEMFVQWLDQGTTKTDNLLCCIRAWILGDKLGCDPFCNYAMSILLERHGALYVHPALIVVPYQHSMPGSKLRYWILDEYLHDNGRGEIVYGGKNWDRVAVLESFLADVAKACMLKPPGCFKDPRANSGPYFI